MTTLLLIGVFVILVLRTLCRAKTQVNHLKDRMLESAQAGLRDQSKGIPSETDAASRRSKFIFQSYCEQLYGGVESTPLEKYAVLRNAMKEGSKPA